MGLRGGASQGTESAPKSRLRARPARPQRSRRPGAAPSPGAVGGLATARPPPRCRGRRCRRVPGPRSARAPTEHAAAAKAEPRHVGARGTRAAGGGANARRPPTPATDRHPFPAILAPQGASHRRRQPGRESAVRQPGHPPTTRGPSRPARTLSPRRRHAQHTCSWASQPQLLPTPRRVRTRGSPAATRKEPATALLLKQARCDDFPPRPRQSGAAPCPEDELKATVGNRGEGFAALAGQQRAGGQRPAKLGPVGASAKARNSLKQDLRSCPKDP